MPKPLMPYGSEANVTLVAKAATVSKARLLMPYGSEGNAQPTVKVADIGKSWRAARLDS